MAAGKIPTDESRIPSRWELKPALPTPYVTGYQGRIPSRWELKLLRVPAPQLFWQLRRIPSRWELKLDTGGFDSSFNRVEFHPVGN